MATTPLGNDQTAAQYWQKRQKEALDEDPVIKALADLLGLEPDWNGEDAKPIDQGAVKLAQQVYSLAFVNDVPILRSKPDVWPSPTGGVDLYWNRNGRELLLSFEPDGIIDLQRRDNGASSAPARIDLNGAASALEQYLIPK